MNSHLFASLILAATLASPAFAQERQADHRLGQHPAVIVKERSKTQGYDYVAKFYPHPAWLYLLPEAPGTTESPADVAARQEQREVTAAPAPAPLAKARN